MTERLAILGMRLAPSLHLGHYIGNISPALSIVDNAQIVVILADLATFASQREKDLSKKNAIALVADCMATGLTSEQVLFALQSQIAVETNVLQSIIGNMISFAQLSRIQPIRAMLSSKNNKVTASAVTFPLIEASEAIALKADYLISNVDNLGVVSLIRHIEKKLATKYRIILPLTELKHGKVPLLYGFDRRKMGYDNNNAIFLNSDDKYIGNFVRKMRTDPTGIITNSSVSIDFSLVCQYLNLFGYNEAEIQLMKDKYDSGKITSLEIKEQLARLIIKFLSPIRKKREALIADNQPEIWARIQADTAHVRNIAATNSKQIIDAIFSTAGY